MLTGLGVIGGSWVLVQRWWVSAPLALAVGVWWWLFLVLAPKTYREQQNTDQPPDG